LASQQGGLTELEYKLGTGEDLKACYMVMLGIVQSYALRPETDRLVYFELVQRVFTQAHDILIRQATAIEEIKKVLA
jgi:hypothetical protein